MSTPHSTPDPSLTPATRAARVLVFLPSWLGDTVMATPALRLLREALPRGIVVGLTRPGIAELLAGSDLLDDVMEADARRLMGPAKVASRLIPMKFDAAVLLPNSFASAMTVRLAGISLRIGYDRDARGLLLTHKLPALKRTVPPWSSPGYLPVSAVDYYLAAARAALSALHAAGFAVSNAAPVPRLELALTPADERAAQSVLARAGALGDADQPIPFALLNPGGNNPAKRWPAERFAALAHHLIERHRLKVLINGAPSEAEIVSLIRDAIVLNHPEDEGNIACLTEHGISIGALKGVVRAARLMVTNDTGPRHLAAAFATPCVAIFGPTDPRWTTLPPPARGPAERIIVADPSLPDTEVADEHPQRCRIDKVETARVVAAVDEMLQS